MFAIFVVAALLPASTILGVAGGARIVDTAVYKNSSVKAFEDQTTGGETSHNTTLFVPINASAKVFASQLNLSGQYAFANLSGKGTAGNDQEGYGKGMHGGGDYNNDGYADFAVGAFAEGSTAGASRVDVFYGSPKGLRGTDANWTYNGPAASGFGWSIAHGDYNNDAIDDLVVGESDIQGIAPAETVYVFYGSLTGLPASASRTLIWNASTSFSWGWSLAGAMDLDDDGYQDLVVGEAFNFTVTFYEGTITVLWGGPGGLSIDNSTVVTGFTTSFSGGLTDPGVILEALGDTDGDGFGEFAVGTAARGGTGRVDVFEGNASRGITNVWNFTNSVASFFGWAVAGGFDITGDGFADLAVGAPTDSATNGAVYIFNGKGNATYAANTSRILRPLVTTTVDQFGAAVEIISDLDGDLKSDLVVGSNAADNFDGRVYIYRAWNLSTAAADVIRPNSTGLQESSGWVIAATGDMDGDGTEGFGSNMASGINGSFAPGSVRLYFGGNPLLPTNVKVFVNQTQVASVAGPINANVTVTGLGPGIQAYLDAHQADTNATGYIWVPLAFNFSGGRLNVSKIVFTYSIVSPPVGINVTTPAVGSSVVVSWNLHATDATVYSIWSNKTGSWQVLANVSVPRTFYNDTNVTDGVEYWYYLTEWDPLVQLQSAPSVTVSATPRDLLPPTTPLNITIAVNTTGHSVTINWTQNVDDTASYEIWRRDDNTSPFVWHATVNKPGSTFTDANLLEEVDYSYQVRAIDDGGIPSPFGAILAARIPDLTPPLAPVNLAGVSEPSGTSVTLTWDLNAADTVGYAVFRSPSGLPGTFAELTQVTVGTASMTGLARNTTFYFQVVAIDKVGLRSPPSATVSVLTVDTEPPLAPVLQDVSAPAVGNSLIVNWSAAGDDLAGFRVYTNASGAWVVAVQMGATARSAIVTNLTDGVAAFVRVSAFDLLDHEGPFSAVLSGTPADTQRPGPPPSTSVTSPPAGSALTVTWTAPGDSDVTTYRIYFLDPTVSADFVFAGSVGASTLSFTKSPVTNGGTLRFRVAAVDEAGNEGPFGPDAVGIAKDTLAPAAPSLSPGPAATNIVNFPITGTAEPNIRVELWVRGGLQATVNADATGHFTAEARLIRGDNEIYARAVDTSPVIETTYKFSANSATLHIVLDPDRPTVVSAVPANDATGVAAAASVVLIMSEPLAPSSIQLTLKDADGNEVAGNITYSDAAHSVTFHPDAPLKGGTLYRAQLSATDLAGNALGAYSVAFTTAPAGSAGGGGGLPAPGLAAVIAALGAAGALVALRGGQRRRR